MNEVYAAAKGGGATAGVVSRTSINSYVQMEME